MKNGYFTVKNWDKFQHYKDRNPPWIKLHRELLTDYEFACLQDASKLHLMMIWLYASQCNNRVPNDPAFLKNALHFDAEPNLKELNKHGFIQFDSSALADCNQSAMLETEAEAETEKEQDRSFDQFWKVYPKKRKKKQAEGIWKRKKLSKLSELIISDVCRREKSDRTWVDGFIPDPTTYLNGERWQDEIEQKIASVAKFPYVPGMI